MDQERSCAALAAATSEQRRPQYAAFYGKNLALPEFVPATANIMVDAMGHLWVQRYRLPWDRTAAHDVFDPTGRWLGQVTMPPDVEVFQIGPDFVLGRHRDDLGIERVVLHALDRRTGV